MIGTRLYHCIVINLELGDLGEQHHPKTARTDADGIATPPKSYNSYDWTAKRMTKRLRRDDFGLGIELEALVSAL